MSASKLVKDREFLSVLFPALGPGTSSLRAQRTRTADSAMALGAIVRNVHRADLT